MFSSRYREEKHVVEDAGVEVEGATAIYHAHKKGKKKKKREKKGLNHSAKESLDVFGQVQVNQSL